jgi:Domain of unknown function (DUF4468) with TBP-like fold
MMKTCFSLFLLIALSLSAKAQFLPLNEEGKCELAEVVQIDSLSRITLFSNELTWLKGFAKEEGRLCVIRDSLRGKVSGNFEFPVYAQSGILRKLSGTVRYQFVVEAKDGKYRYAFTDFVFYYFKQDRTYKMVKTGNTKHLEEKEAKGWQKLWTNHRMATYTEATGQVNQLKSIMKEVPHNIVAKSEVKKVDW